MPFAATCMDLIILSEVSQRKISYDNVNICGISKMIQMNLFTKQKQTHRHREQTLVAKGEEGWGRDGSRAWD